MLVSILTGQNVNEDEKKNKLFHPVIYKKCLEPGFAGSRHFYIVPPETGFIGLVD
jgi:hypothetical protein